METIVKQLVTYAAIDGEIFNSAEECRAYEDRLPKHLRWCLAHKVTAEKLAQEGVWHVGYQIWTSYTTYEASGFLFTCQDYEHSVFSRNTIAYVWGTFSDAVAWAVNQLTWFREDGFIEAVNVIDLIAPSPDADQGPGGEG